MAKAIGVGSNRGQAAQLLLAASPGGGLLASDDAGGTWRAAGADFGGTDVVSIALSPAHARDGTIFVATLAPTSAGDGELTVWRSSDGSERWQRWPVEKVGMGRTWCP